MSWISLLSNNLDLNQMCAYMLGYHWCGSHVISQDVWMSGIKLPFPDGPPPAGYAHILCILPRALACVAVGPVADQGLFSLVSSSPLTVTVFLSPLLQGWDLVETSHLGPSSPRSLTLPRVQLWFSCICSHLLEEETSVMILCSDPWAQQIVVRNPSWLCDCSRRGLAWAVMANLELSGDIHSVLSHSALCVLFFPLNFIDLLFICYSFWFCFYGVSVCANLLPSFYMCFFCFFFGSFVCFASFF